MINDTVNARVWSTPRDVMCGFKTLTAYVYAFLHPPSAAEQPFCIAHVRSFRRTALVHTLYSTILFRHRCTLTAKTLRTRLPCASSSAVGETSVSMSVKASVHHGSIHSLPPHHQMTTASLLLATRSCDVPFKVVSLIIRIDALCLNTPV